MHMISSYGEYLRADELLSLQHPVSSRPSDELVFIVAHQACELWFKLILADLNSAVRAFDSTDGRAALHCLRRVADVEGILLAQMVLLETFDPVAFADIRPALGTASGAQSRQYVAIERLSTESLAGSASPATRDVWSAFVSFVGRSGFVFPQDDTEFARSRRVATLADIYRSVGAGGRESDAGATLIRDLAESLIEHDQRFSMWRYRHMLTAIRQIGTSPGTGGTAGGDWLERRLAGRRFFPELWDLRTALATPATVDRPRVGLVSHVAPR